ncbi:MAG: tRNA glutamyl-Q(34) synthetase GluQRS [Acidaminococcaceae bacterium]|nr:tRNA glutamyl-Q(34) synthetase GluQRS [Acidaminococcaceae bacterium]
MVVGRFAPTPSGRMHLGNIYAMLCAWAKSRKFGGEIVLRIEDLDKLRCPRSNAETLIDDLYWLGLDWDKGPYFQSERIEIYQKYTEILKQKRVTFPCFCSRGELHIANAPHTNDGIYRYPGTCRNLTKEQIAIKSFWRSPALRVRVDDRVICFEDEHYGIQKSVLDKNSGDFIVCRSDGVYAYHLAVVVDDAIMGVTEIVRGADLLGSVPVQLYLYELLEFERPSYCHIPLFKIADGRRLAKRDGDLDMGTLRKKYSAEDIIGYIAWQVGFIDKWEKMNKSEFLSVFEIDKLPMNDIVLNYNFDL